jgi:acid phosphatase
MLFVVPLVAAVPLSQSLDFFVVGDWGSGSTGQKSLAQTMNALAKNSSTAFVAALGDNFYEFGVSNTEDKKFDTVWKNVYNDYLQTIPWYTVLGNHDWYGNVQAQIDYSSSQKNWISDFFYTHVETVGGVQAAFIYIDTDLMNYGYNCFRIECALINFKKAGWSRESNTLESQFNWVEDQLKQHQDKDYLFVMGHHNIEICNPRGSMPRLGQLLESYNVSAYFFGHKHSLAYKKVKNTSYILTGAAGKKEGECGDSQTWKKGDVFGFVHSRLTSHSMNLDFVDEKGSILYSQQISPRK